MICERCQELIPEGDEMNYMGTVLCEDCYVEAVSLPKTCDVAAVYSAKLSRKLAGQKGTEGLTELQKEIYEYVKANGKVTPEALAKEFHLSVSQLQREFTTLRHCELLKGTKIDDILYILIMEGGPGSIDL
jgi:AraC-like DNA-binding protein